MRFADFWQTPLGIFVAGTVLIGVFGSIFALGTTIYFRIQNVAFAFATLAVAAAGLVALLTSRETFIARFDEYVRAVGGVENAFRVAWEGSGYRPHPVDAYQTFLSLS